MKLKNQKLIAIFLSLFSWFAVFGLASAHVTQTDGSISAIMHIEPDDDPIVGQPTDFFFEFLDQASKFKTADCNCTATISQNGKQLFSTQLFKTNDTSDFVTPLFSYSFPSKGVYDVQVSGSPKTAGEFQTFSLDYNVRVDRETVSAAAAPAPQNHLFHFLLFGGAFLVVLILYVKEKRKGKSKSSKSVVVPLLAAIALASFLIHGSMLDTALCLHNHPVMQDHQCCVAAIAIATTPASFNNQFAYFFTLEIKKQEVVTINFNFSSSRSPPNIA